MKTWLRPLLARLSSHPRQPVRRLTRQWSLESLEAREVPAFVINPTFDKTITDDTATIEASINAVIQNFENAFTDNITVNITFAEGNGQPGGSSTQRISVAYNDLRATLASHATTAADSTALASLPNTTNNPVNNDPNVIIRTAVARALGFSTSTSSDSTITLNTSGSNLDLLSINTGKYDLLAVASHEIDEALAFGSSLNGLNNGDAAPTAIREDDLFRFDQTGARSYDTNLATQSFFSIDGGTTDLARFNQTQGGDYSDWYSPGGQTPQVQDAFNTQGHIRTWASSYDGSTCSVSSLLPTWRRRR